MLLLRAVWQRLAFLSKRRDVDHCYYRSGSPTCEITSILHAVLVQISLACLTIFSIAAHAGENQYVYDASGRVVEVITPTGANAQYGYDEVGNILSIKNNPASSVWIAGFTPVSVPVGAVITIYGGGFSTTPSNNVVKFNGTVATVSTGTSTTLTVTVPAGATTGKISITNANGSATSLTDFVVSSLALNGAPTFLNLAANQVTKLTFSGTAGDGMGLGLTNVSTAPQGGTVTVNVLKPDGSTLVTCGISTAKGGCLLPYLPVTGTYSVTLTAGINAASLNLALSADVVAALALNGAPVLTTSAKFGQAVTYSFSGTAGQQYENIWLSGDTFQGITAFIVYRPDGAQLVSTSISYSSGAGSSGALVLPSIPITGTYKLRVMPANGATGSVSAALTQDVTGALAIDGVSTAVNLVSNQSGRYSFNGTAGAALGIGYSGLSTTPAGGTVSIAINKPDGSLLTTCSASTANGGCVLSPLPVSGTYTVKVTSVNTATLNLQLSSDATANLSVNGPAAAVTIVKVGQAATYSFSGTAGQNLNLILSNDTILGNTYFYVYKPDGTSLNYTSVSYSSGAGTGGNLSLGSLPASGTYTVRVMPSNGATGSITAALTQDVAGTLTVDGAATAASLNNQKGRYTFSGTAGQWLGLGITGLATTPANNGVSVSILKPDGSTLASCSASSANSGCALPVLPASGTYTVLVSLSGSASAATLNLLLSSDATGTLTANGSGQTFGPTRVGQAAAYNFSGTAGQNLNLVLTGDTFAGYTYVYVYKPDGTSWTSTYSYYSSGAGTGTTLALTNLPASGTYTARIVPPSGVTGSITAALQ